ncbi:MAG: sigma-70 family RNA polymerase sigma factor, partial [Myxococcaceae bacterium]
YGQVGLLEAADRFDPKIGANFLTFAHYRIKGAIFDGLRKMGVLKGPDLRTAYAGERAAAYLGNLSDRESGGNRGGSFDDDVRELSNAVTGLAAVFAASMEGADSLQLADETLPADQRIELEQLKTRVRTAISKLPEKERKLLQGYYFQSKTLEEAGSEIGQSKSWASRLHARAIERLKDLLSQEEDSFEHVTGSSSHGSSNRPNPSRTSSSTEGPGATGDPEAGPVGLRRPLGKR